MGIFRKGDGEEYKRFVYGDPNQRTVYEKLGLTIEDDSKIQKEVLKAEIDAQDSKTYIITDLRVIEILFPDLSAREKLKIFYYGHLARRYYK